MAPSNIGRAASDQSLQQAISHDFHGFSAH
jgi:hypothetical protein